MSSAVTSHSHDEEPLAWSATVRSALQRRLLAWFVRSRRSFPWRANRDPYRIWVSEVMLQQTVAQVAVPYFERFIAAFPTLEALAAADEREVLQLWQGLGYYRRARNLHAAARQLVRDYGGQLPNDPTVWCNLPGVGRYIAAAVLSQAFDRRLPIVEANSLRVLARLYGYRGDPRRGAGQRWVWQAAEKLLPPVQVGEFNQALMELGSLVCTPRQPRCDVCPWRDWCRALARGQQEQIPPPPQRPPIAVVQELAVLICNGSRLLLCQRPASASRWPLLWEVPHAEQAEPPSPDAVRRLAHQSVGVEVEPLQALPLLRYSVTRFRITMHAWTARYCQGSFASEFYIDAVWVTPEEADRYPLSSPQRRLLERWRKGKDCPEPPSLF